MKNWPFFCSDNESSLCVCSSMAPPWSISFPSLFLDWRGSQLDPQSHSGRNLQLWPRHQPASKGVQVLKANVHLVGLAALNPPVTSFPTSITDSLTTTAQALKDHCYPSLFKHLTAMLINVPERENASSVIPAVPKKLLLSSYSDTFTHTHTHWRDWRHLCAWTNDLVLPIIISAKKRNGLI